MQLENYDSGFLNDFGGGNVGWWQDYLRSELDKAHEFYEYQLTGSREALLEEATILLKRANRLLDKISKEARNG